MNNKDLAESLAREIFAIGDEPDDKVQRIQFCGGSWLKNAETNLGGLNRDALARELHEILDRLVPKVGCERDDGLLNIHPETDTCEVCKDV